MGYTLTTNTELKGIEISFNDKPDRNIIDALKGCGFKWHSKKKLWYAKNTPERMETAQAICKGEETTAAPHKSPKQKQAPANKYGVNVGDIFLASWGFEQTNNNFFQVVTLIGKSSVRVREVYLPTIDKAAVSSMAEDRTFRITRDLLPAAKHSVFIEDQERGDLKRLKSYAADGKSNPQFRLTNFCDAHYCGGDAVTVYESWYA